MSNLINLSNTTPAAPAGGQNVLWQSDASNPTNVSAYLPGSSNNAVFVGPSPWFDVTYYGARAISAYQTALASTSGASQTTVTLNSAIDFQNGDGIVIWQGGNTAASTSAPTAPTVLCGAVVGSQTFKYLCVGVDEHGGLSAASAATTITNAPAVFGNLPVVISSITQTTNVVTVNTATPINAITGQQVTIVGVTGAGAGFIGTYAVASAPTASQFTYALTGNAGSGTVGANSTARLSNTYNISAITRTGTTISITTNANHNFNYQSSNNPYYRTIAVVQGVDQQNNTGGTADLNGQYVVLSASGSSLTLDSALNYSITETGILTGTAQWSPTVTVYEYIVVTCPLVYPEPFAFYVYANYGSGTYQLIGRTLPYEGTFIDYGLWQNQDFGAPAYVPTTTTPGAATQPQLYAGKITAGAGTTTLTVTPAVPQHITNATIMHDNTVAITAAMTAANAVQGGTVFFPPASGSYAINAPVSMPSNSVLSFLVGGELVVNETIMNLNAQFMSWKRAPGISGTAGIAQFGPDAPVSIIGIANPMFFSYNGPLQLEGFGFSGTHSCGQTYVNTLGGGGDNFQARDCTFVVGGSTGPTAAGTSIPVILQAGAGYQACPHFTNCTFIGYFYGIGNGGVANGNINLGPNIPLLSLRADEYNNLAPQGLLMDGVNTFAGRGILFDGTLGQFTAQADISIYENESPTTPTVMIVGKSSGGQSIRLSHFQNDSQPGAIIANWAAFSSPPGVVLDNCVTSGYNSQLTGSVIPGLVVTNSQTPVGQNVNFQAFQMGQGGDGGTDAQLTGVEYQGVPQIMAGPLNPCLAWPFSPVTGVTAVSSGSHTIAAATYIVYVTPVGWNGFEGLAIAANGASVTVDGSHGISASWTAQAGVQGYNVYLFGGSISGSAQRQNASLVTTNSLLITTLSNYGVFPKVDNSGLPLLDNTGITAQMVRLTDPVKQSIAVQYYTKTVTLSSAQLLALYATPISVLPAPGTNLMYVVQSVSVQYRYLTSAYTLNSATELIFGYTSAPATYPVAQSAVTGLVDQTHSVVTQMVFTNSNNASADVINQAMYVTNNTANLSAGVGTVTLVISYSVVNATSV